MSANFKVNDPLAAVGTFEHVLGIPGRVVAAPHGTADTGSYEMAASLQELTGMGAVYVTGFWDARTRHRVNVNRPTEQIISRDVDQWGAEEWTSDRAFAATDRYRSLVMAAAQGPLTLFLEIHSFPYFEEIHISTLGLTWDETKQLKDELVSLRDRNLPRWVPRYEIRVGPYERVWPNYVAASQISAFSKVGILIEHPASLMRSHGVRVAYAEVLVLALNSRFQPAAARFARCGG